MDQSLERFKEWLRLLLQTKINNKCVRCGSNVRYKSISSNSLICTCSSCKKIFTCYRGTILENYKKTIEIFYQTIKLIMENVKLKLFLVY